MEFLIDEEMNSNSNHGDSTRSTFRSKRNIINPDIAIQNNSYTPVFYTKEQREKMIHEDIKKKEEEEKKRKMEIKNHLNEYLNSKYQDNSRSDKNKHRSRSRSDSRDRKRKRERSIEREINRKGKKSNKDPDKMISLQEKEKEEIKVRKLFYKNFI
jgi:hypothetical protein